MKRVKRVLAYLLVVATVFAFTPFLSYEAYADKIDDGNLIMWPQDSETFTLKGKGTYIVLDEYDFDAVFNTTVILYWNGMITRELDNGTWKFDYDYDGSPDFSLNSTNRRLTALTDYSTLGKDTMSHTVEGDMDVPDPAGMWSFGDESAGDYEEGYPYYTKLTFKFCNDIRKASISLSPSSGTLVYTGKARAPGVTVRYNGKTLTKGTSYTVSGSRTSIGPGTLTITGKGHYRGTVKKSFKIVPSKVTISGVTGGTKQFTVKWGKRPGEVKYQIKYRVKGTSTWKNTTSTTTSKTVKNLTKGKTYEVKVRAYKTVNGTNYYGAFSDVKTVKVK